MKGWVGLVGWSPDSGHPSAEGRAQDRVSSPAKDRRSANCATQPTKIDLMSVKYYIPVPVFHFWSKQTHVDPAARFLCYSWASCFIRTECGIAGVPVRNAWKSTRTLTQSLSYCEKLNIILEFCTKLPFTCETRALGERIPRPRRTWSGSGVGIRMTSKFTADFFIHSKSLVRVWWRFDH